MPLTNPSALGFASKYPIDKIVTRMPYMGTFTCTGFNNGTFDPGTGSVTITHNLNKKCLPELLWSSDGINYRLAPQEDDNRLAALAACDTNTVTVYAYQGLGTSTQTIYYILYLLWPN